MKHVIQNLLLFLLLCCTLPSKAQDIQWASELEFQFNHFAEEQWSGQQVLGPPNAKPGRMDPKAFRLKSRKDYGTLVLLFAKPQPVRQLILIENFEPGSVVEINFYDQQANKHPVYTGEANNVPRPSRAFMLNFPKTPYKVQKVEININTINTDTWYQLDAVGISNFIEAGSADRVLKKYGSYNVDQTVAFAGEREKLNPKINSSYDETKPLISPDGQFLYLARQYYPENERGTRDPQDIYLSQQLDNEWLLPVNVGEPLNNGNGNGICSVTPDGNKVLLINTYSQDGTYNAGAAISRRSRNGWSEPEPLYIEGYYRNSEYVDYCMSNSGKVIIMAIERDDSYGDQDLYVSFLRKNGTWSVPLNMGLTINSEMAEFAPFLAADDQTIYFASFGHNSMGESDIFFSKRLDDSWQKWSEPKNMGSKVNSEAYDAYYTTTALGDYAYFVSKKDGTEGSKDIYRIALPKEAKPEPVALISGKVFNAKTGEPIFADILFEDLSDGKEVGTAQSNPQNGDFKIVLPRGKEYGFLAEAEGFISVNENINLQDINQYREVERDLYLVPIEAGQKVQLNNIFFKQSSAELKNQSFPELQRLIKFMKENPTVKIRLEGHTDNRGIAKVNMKLSQDRVKTVKEFLTDNDIAGSRITMKGYGGLKPIASNADPEQRKLNRRVEIVITDY